MGYYTKNAAVGGYAIQLRADAENILCASDSSSASALRSGMYSITWSRHFCVRAKRPMPWMVACHYARVDEWNTSIVFSLILILGIGRLHPHSVDLVSRTLRARHPPHTNARHGFIPRTTLTTRPSESTNVASIGKDMKKVCIALQRSMRSPSPGGSSFVPISPFARSANVRATFALTPSISTVSMP